MHFTCFETEYSEPSDHVFSCSPSLLCDALKLKQLYFHCHEENNPKHLPVWILPFYQL